MLLSWFGVEQGMQDGTEVPRGATKVGSSRPQVPAACVAVLTSNMYGGRVFLGRA